MILLWITTFFSIVTWSKNLKTSSSSMGFEFVGPGVIQHKTVHGWSWDQVSILSHTATNSSRYKLIVFFTTSESLTVCVCVCVCVCASSILHIPSRDKTGLAVGIPKACISKSITFEVVASVDIKATVSLDVTLCSLVVGTGVLENTATSKSG